MVRSNGLIGHDLEEGDELAESSTAEGQELILVTEQGSAALPARRVRTARSRTAAACAGSAWSPATAVAAWRWSSPKAQLLVVTRERLRQAHALKAYPQQGARHGRRADARAHRQDRAGGGSAGDPRHRRDDGHLGGRHDPRTGIVDIRETGRAAQGVTIINLRGNDHVACIAILNGADHSDE